MTLQSLIGYTEPSDLIYNPNNEETPLILKVYKNDTKHYKDTFRAFSNRKFVMSHNEENLTEIEGTKTLKTELLNELGLEFILSMVCGWDGMIDANTNEPVEFSKELLKEIVLENVDLVKIINNFIENEEGKSTKKRQKAS